MPEANSRKWQLIDLETLPSEFPINEWTEAEPEERSFDNWGLHATRPVSIPTLDTKKGVLPPGAHIVVQTTPKPPCSSAMAGLPLKRKRESKAEGEKGKSDSPEMKDQNTGPTPQQPWDTACKALNCPIKYPHNYGLSSFEPPHQHLQKDSLHTINDEFSKFSRFSRFSKDAKSFDQDVAGIEHEGTSDGLVDEEDGSLEEEGSLFLGRNVYMPPEVDSAEQRNIHYKGTSEDKKLLQAFYSAHGSKRQYYGFLGNGIQYHKHSDVNYRPLKSDLLAKESQKKKLKKVKDKCDSLKSDHRISAHG